MASIGNPIYADCPKCEGRNIHLAFDNMFTTRGGEVVFIMRCPICKKHTKFKEVKEYTEKNRKSE